MTALHLGVPTPGLWYGARWLTDMSYWNTIIKVVSYTCALSLATKCYQLDWERPSEAAQIHICRV